MFKIKKGKPSTGKYVDLTEEKLTFSGSAGRSTLYTNKHFIDKQYYLTFSAPSDFSGSVY